MVSDESREEVGLLVLIKRNAVVVLQAPRPAAAPGVAQERLLRGVPPCCCRPLSTHRGAGGLLLAPPQRYDGSEKRVGSVVWIGCWFSRPRRSC